MIKKCILCLTLVLFTTQAFAIGVNDLFEEFSKESNVEKVHINKFLMKLANAFSKETKGIDSMDVLDLSDCNAETKERFCAKAKKLKDGKYETLVRSNDGDEHVQVLLLIKKEIIRELVVVVSGEDCTLVRIKGKIKQSDIETLVNR